MVTSLTSLSFFTFRIQHSLQMVLQTETSRSICLLLWISCSWLFQIVHIAHIVYCVKNFEVTLLIMWSSRRLTISRFIVQLKRRCVYSCIIIMLLIFSRPCCCCCICFTRIILLCWWLRINCVNRIICFRLLLLLLNLNNLGINCLKRFS